MNIFNIPYEIRLKIYLELLVLLKPIVFIANYGPLLPLLFRFKRNGLCLALLRINKRIYNKANILLYSSNYFQFPKVLTYTLFITESAYIALFLYLTGSQASYIRYICIPFPIFNYP